MFISPLAIAVGITIYGVIGLCINAFPNKKLINYKFSEQIFDIYPQLILSLIIFIIVYSIGTINANLYLLLIIQIFTALLVYFLIARYCITDTFMYILSLIKGLVNHKKL